MEKYERLYYFRVVSGLGIAYDKDAGVACALQEMGYLM